MAKSKSDTVVVDEQQNQGGAVVRIDAAFGFRASGYIGKPFWPERNTLINIAKDVHPKLNEVKKKQAILAACEKRGITPEEYERICDKASWPFYTDGDREAEIIIPARVFHSFLNHTSMAAPKAIPRITEKGLTFIGVHIQGGAFHTGKTEADSLRFERFVKLEESNQRSFSSDPYIIDFQAQGVIELDTEVITASDLRKLVEYGGRWIGIGGARPQGFGRFVVERWEIL